MKNKPVYSFVFLIITYLYPAISFSQQAIKPDAFTTLENEFEASRLSPVQLEAFETRAIQKLKDLVDYYQVVNETSYPRELREQAVKIIRGLFADSTHSISFLDKKDAKPVYEYFALPVNPQIVPPLPAIENINVQKSFKEKSNGIYMGELRFQSVDSQKKQKSSASVEIILIRQSKQFGSEKSVIWEVKLGNIAF